jgi:nucleoside-diphosphate-sugar epimerase
MLTHLHTTPQQPSRVVVVGAGGFIGAEVVARLRDNAIPVLPIARPTLDLLSAAAAANLAATLHPEDVLIFAAAQAPCKDLAMLQDNLRMAEAVCNALQTKPVAHGVYLSSDAVYKDSLQPLTEASCAEPGSLHGVMHLAREVALRQAYPGPLTFVRPTLVYGFNDPHNGYGPNRFRRQAAKGEDIVLFGEGEERRDHVAVEDVAELIYRVVMHRTIGIANATSGEVVSFRDLAEYAAKEFSPHVQVIGSPRSGPMPHGGYRPFDNRAVLAAFPGFRFKSWREGLAAVHARQRESFLK